jgi:hypothetical protein
MSNAARRAEILRRYKRRQRGSAMSIAVLRIKEIGYLLNHRYRRHGYTLPKSATSRDIAFAMACHLARRPKAEHRIERWLGLWCPWMAGDERTKLVARTIAKPHRLTADKVGSLLKLTEDERNGLDIRTIGSFEISKAERAERRKETRRQREERRRRSKGAKSRAEYEELSLSSTKPWITLGMSRAAWYRAKKPTVTKHHNGLRQVRGQYS